jgi:hypothetical protein
MRNEIFPEGARYSGLYHRRARYNDAFKKRSELLIVCRHRSGLNDLIGIGCIAKGHSDASVLEQWIVSLDNI